jgi:4-hydroxybenzoate polyprenyltransferase
VICIFYDSPYISILKLKGSIVDLSVAAATCAILGVGDYRVIIAVAASMMIHSGCDIINDIYDLEIDKICKPDGAIASGRIPLKKAWAYMILLFSASLALILILNPILFLSGLAGIILGGIMYSHPLFRLKDKPGIAMTVMALCFSLESLGVWSIYASIDANALVVAAYIFVLIFSLTFMKDFKDVAGDINSLPLKLGPRRAAKVCCALTMLPLIPLVYLITQYPSLFLAGVVYVVLGAGCIKILMGDPVKNGVKLKNWMIMALTLPNFAMLL